MEINKRILIVDDNTAIHGDFQKILNPMRNIEISEEYLSLENSLFKSEARSAQKAINIEYELDFALQGEEALTMILDARDKENPYAIVFTDVRMPPGIDGVQLVSQILKKVPYTEIVIVTAFSDYTWEEMTECFGWTDRLLFLRKPFDVITVRQIAMTLTKKWSLGYKARQMAQERELHLNQLEKLVQERTAKLAQANKDLQNFAYIVSHDLSSPLLSVQGFVGELRLSIEDVKTAVRDLWPGLDAEKQKMLKTAIEDHIPEALAFIDTSAMKMESLIKAVLKLSRLGYREFHFENVNMGELIDRNLKALAYQIEKNGVRVTVEPMPTITSDRLTLEQVFGNLLSNAVKFLDPERPGLIEISAEEGDEEATFHIKDNGYGISEKEIPHVFDIFRRAGAQNVPGEGMGLAFVKILLGHLGGGITCQSVQGRGATFSFTVPYGRENVITGSGEPEDKR